jgi:hypothetical protein
VVAIALELLPPFQFKKIVTASTKSIRDGVILHNDRQKLHGDLPILPFNHDIVGTAIVVLVILK